MRSVGHRSRSDRKWHPADCSAGRASPGEHFRNVRKEQISHAVTFGLVAQEVEEFVFLDGPADGRTILFERHRPLWLGNIVEVISRVPGAVASESVSGAMKAICTGFYSNINDGPSLSTIFRLRIFLD